MTTSPDPGQPVPPDPWTHLLETPIPIPTVEKHWNWISALKAADAEVKRLRSVIQAGACDPAALNRLTGRVQTLERALQSTRELGPDFHAALQFAGPEHARTTGASLEDRLRYLHTAVVELAKVVERKPLTTNRTLAGNATVCAHARMHAVPVADGARCFRCDDCGLLLDVPGQVL